MGPRIAITCVLVLGLGYMAMIITTLKKYGSQPGSTRTSANLGMGNRNTMQGGVTPIHGNSAQGQGAAASEKKIRARDIDAAMERRGRQREKSTSTTRIRRREEDVERRQQGGQLGLGDKGGRISKGMYGLGLGSDIELKKLPEMEMDLKIDGLPWLKLLFYLFKQETTWSIKSNIYIYIQEIIGAGKRLKEQWDEIYAWYDFLDIWREGKYCSESYYWRVQLTLEK
jgi:hypothetical protein